MTTQAVPADTTIELGSMHLGPSLPPLAYASTERWHAERIGALALYCSDGRWGEAFDEFCPTRRSCPKS